MSGLRVTRPCRNCKHKDECWLFIRELTELIDKHTMSTCHALPEVVVDCQLYIARRLPPDS